MKADVRNIDFNNRYNHLLSHEVLRKTFMKYMDFFPNVTSCASSVIDTKIEQAMDLVKNHLVSTMHAEVEGLKARIAELMERIHQLEKENDFLKANATPEVLNALNNGAAQAERYQESSDVSIDYVISSPTQSATM